MAAFSTLPFSASAWAGTKVDLADATFFEVPEGKLYNLLTAHVAEFSESSFRVGELDGGDARKAKASKAKASKCCGSKRVDAGGAAAADDDFRYTQLELGLGRFKFRSSCTGGEEVWALHQTRGDPVGTSCGVSLYTSLVLLVPGAGRQLVLQRTCEALIAKAEATEKNTITMYRWHIRHSYWQKESRAVARPVSSVVLPSTQKRALVADFDSFLGDDTKEWYQAHGIPYRRSYLFHGVPGTGKTSLVSALAGKYGRNVCFLQPSHPQMTDDGLKSAVQRVPSDSFIVFEDIDSLFDKQRNNKIPNSSLTFSGMLNALDGVGAPKGQIFILTTNFREQLDSALIRNGRVDMHVKFGHATPEQFAGMFRQFYPGAAPDLVHRFVRALQRALGQPRGAELESKLESEPECKVDNPQGQGPELPGGAGRKKAAARGPKGPAPKAQAKGEKPGAAEAGAAEAAAGARQITTCVLQHFFVQCRTKSAEQAVAAVGAVLEEMLLSRDEDAAAKTKEATAGEEAEAAAVAKKAKKKKKGRRGKRRGGRGGRGAIHIHVHGGSSGGDSESEQEEGGPAAEGVVEESEEEY